MSTSKADGPVATERLSALVALAAAVVLVVVAAARNWEGVLIALVGLLVVVVGGWYAVSRRGMVRSVALLTVLVGVAVLIAGVVVADFSAVSAVSIVVLAGVSVVSAWSALHSSERALHAVAASRTPAAPATHTVLIMTIRIWITPRSRRACSSFAGRTRSPRALPRMSGTSG